MTAGGAIADLSTRLLAALRRSCTDFRTVQSLAAEFNVPVDEVRAALAELGDVVRTPVVGGYPDWWRLTARGLTWQEKVGQVRAMAGHLDGESAA